MNTLKTLTIILAAAIALTFTAGIRQAQATTLATGELITNGTFGSNAAPTLGGWDVAGTANARPTNNILNTAAGNAGFNSFFNDGGFVALGSTLGNVPD